MAQEEPVINASPALDDILNAELIKHTAASEQRKLQQLIGGEELGDRKPTCLLCHMQETSLALLPT